MANAIRTQASRRGVDPRDFSLVAFGGAGPLHGVAVAEELGIGEVLVPQATGVLSAWGMLYADVRHDISLPLAVRADDTGAGAALRTVLDSLRKQGGELLDLEQVPQAGRQFTASADMRYVGQEHSLAVEIVDGADLLAEFHRVYEHRYGHCIPTAPVEFVNVRMAAIAAVGAIDAGPPPTLGNVAPATRTVRIGGVDHEARVVARTSIGATPVPGPAVVQEDGSTTLVPPGWHASRGPAATLFLKKVP